MKYCQCFTIDPAKLADAMQRNGNNNRIFGDGISFESSISLSIKKRKTDMTHVKFNGRPFNRSFNSLLDDIFTTTPVNYRNDLNPNRNGSVPVNITESQNGYTLDVVAPGFEKADFKISLDQNTLTISLDKKEETDESKKAVRKEYSFRSFKRSFNLDDKINADAIDAKYVNGILTLQLPKKEEVKLASKDIAIQ